MTVTAGGAGVAWSLKSVSGRGLRQAEAEELAERRGVSVGRPSAPI
jgi:hypothetical protein